MTYVPDYIRPICPKSPVPVPTTSIGTNKVCQRLPLIIRQPRETLAAERQDDVKSPKSQNLHRLRKSTITTHSQSKCLKSAQDKLCSRLSIQDRLKSLETEAAVKLEVRSKVQRPNRKSFCQRTQLPSLAGQYNESCSVSSCTSTGDTSEKSCELCRSYVTEPDIILSNQPKLTDASGRNSSERKLYELPAVSTYEQVQVLKDSFERLAYDLDEASLMSAVAEIKLPQVAEQISNFSSKVAGNIAEDAKTLRSIDSDANGDKILECLRESADLKEHNNTFGVLEEQSDHILAERCQNHNMASDEESHHISANDSVFKPIWRTPSRKLPHYQRVNESIEVIDDEIPEILVSSSSHDNEGLKTEIHELSEVTETLGDYQEDINQLEPSNRERKGSETFEESMNYDAYCNNEFSTQNTANTAITVEMRSPRYEKNAQELRRIDTTNKRNARVFIVSSSSDSDMESDNHSFKMERSFKNLEQTKDMKQEFTPNGLMNQNCHSADAPIKQAAFAKFVPILLRSSQKKLNPEEKQTLNMSAGIYPELSNQAKLHKKGSKEFGSTLRNCQALPSQNPSERQRSTRCGRSSRSKSSDSVKIRKDANQRRSSSACDVKRKSMEQKAVASAVTSGAGIIPYIDDVLSGTDEVNISMYHSGLQQSSGGGCDGGFIHRCNSADALASFTTEAPHLRLRRPRASSVDRSGPKSFNRRSYQIATMNLESNPACLPTSEKLLHLGVGSGIGVNSDTQLTNARIRSGPLHFKVATIDKGKRTSSQKTWKFVWAILKDQQLSLMKEGSRVKYQAELPLNLQQPLHDEIQCLNVQSSLVGIAYNYLKRRNVFRLTTCNGSEYLFQAENRSDMLMWISAIESQSTSHDNGTDGVNEDLILRKTNQIGPGPKMDKRNARKRSPKPGQKNSLQVKDVDGSRRFKWRGSVNKIVKKFGTGQPFVLRGTFGVHLEDCPSSAENEFVPFIVELCCRIIEERGLDFTGIYRVPGNSAALNALQEDLNSNGVESFGPEDDRLKDLNVVSSLLKLFFRKLPEPLFTNELYHDFIIGNRQPAAEKRLNLLRRLVHMLPAPHYETLKYLISHLRVVANHCKSNKMEVRNLAIVFGPTLVRNTAADNTATMVTDMSDQCRIIESVIDHSDFFFRGEHEEIPAFVRSFHV